MRSHVFSIIAIVAFASCPGCEDSPRTSRVVPAEDQLQAPGVTIVGLASTPERYAEQSVRIQGEVEGVVGRRLYVVRGEGTLWAARIPVVPRSRDALGALPPQHGDEVEVRGVAKTHLSEELARELGPVATAQIGDGPYVIAGSIRRHP